MYKNNIYIIYSLSEYFYDVKLSYYFYHLYRILCAINKILIFLPIKINVLFFIEN